MRNAIPAWIRVSVIFILIIGITEYFIAPEHTYAILEYPILQLVLLIALLFLIAAEVIVSAIENVMYQTLTPESKELYMLQEQKRKEKFSLRKWYIFLAGTRPLAEEKDLEMDHDYDGIKELDNKLPPWWLYSFYATIVFAVGYMAYYHILDGDSQVQEYEKEMAAAQIAMDEYRNNNPDLVNAGNVIALTEISEIEKGKAIYQINCMACHAGDGGGGIGPNLVDDHWILGGGIKNIFQVVSEGGRAGKGMIAWKSTLNPLEIQQVSSYILSLKGTTPASPKDPEGDIWIEE